MMYYSSNEERAKYNFLEVKKKKKAICQFL